MIDDKTQEMELKNKSHLYIYLFHHTNQVH